MSSPFAFTCGSAGGCSDYIVVVRLCKIILYTPIPTSCAFKAVFNFLRAFIFCLYVNFTNWPVKYDIRWSDRPGFFSQLLLIMIKNQLNHKPFLSWSLQLICSSVDQPKDVTQISKFLLTLKSDFQKEIFQMWFEISMIIFHFMNIW